jgi:hypothetical protein
MLPARHRPRGEDADLIARVRNFSSTATLLLFPTLGACDGRGSQPARVHVGGPTPEEQHVHDVACAAQQARFELVRPGVACHEMTASPAP